VLNVCNRLGRFDDAEMYYDNMSKSYGIALELEHDTRMVVAFGQMGCLDKAMSMIRTMSSSSSGEPCFRLCLNTPFNSDL
jgi:pentatricopeptide repeat protein